MGLFDTVKTLITGKQQEQEAPYQEPIDIRPPDFAAVNAAVTNDPYLQSIETAGQVESKQSTLDFIIKSRFSAKATRAMIAFTNNVFDRNILFSNHQSQMEVQIEVLQFYIELLALKAVINRSDIQKPYLVWESMILGQLRNRLSRTTGANRWAVLATIRQVRYQQDVSISKNKQETAK